MLFLWYPPCSTCQRAKAWLESHEQAFDTRHIKESNPTYEELSAWYQASGLPLRRFFNTSGLAYKALNLKARLPEMSEEAQLRLLASDGMLVRRPILIKDQQVLVGFRPDEWQAVL